MQVYKDNGDSTLFYIPPKGEPVTLRFSEYENWVIDNIAREYLKSDQVFRPLRPHEVAEIFPEGKTYLNQRKKDLAVLLEELLEEERALEADPELRKHKNKELKELKKGVIEAKRERLLGERQEADTILGFMNPRKSKAVKNFQVELARAKDYPIEKLLPFIRNKTKCIWHSDSDPSLYLYRKDNRVHCFSCGKGGDSVDVVMQMNGVSIGEAIAFLNQA